MQTNINMKKQVDKDNKKEKKQTNKTIKKKVDKHENDERSRQT